MRQTIQREVLKRHFVPNTAGAVGPSAAEASHGQEARERTGAAEHERRQRPPLKRTLGRTMLRTGSTIFWAILSERVYTRAISQRRASSALLGGSLAAGTAYVQDRSMQRADGAAGRAVSRRSLFSFHAVMGLGLGLGAMLANRRR